MKSQKPTVRINDWAVVTTPLGGRYEKLGPGKLLVGRVFGHPRIDEGSFIFSSPVESVDSDNKIAETKNTAYILGRASFEYKAWSQEQGGAAA